MNWYELAAKVCGWALGIVLASVFCVFVLGVFDSPIPRYIVVLEGRQTYATDAIENHDGIVTFTERGLNGRRVTTTTAHVVSISEQAK